MSGRILIADDFLTNRIVLKARLTASCYEVVQSSHDADVIDLARQTLPDLIILGAGDRGAILKFCTDLKSDRSLGLIPLIVINHISATEQRLEILNAGADEVFENTLDETTLLATIRRLIRSYGTYGYEEVLSASGTDEFFPGALTQDECLLRARISLIAPDVETGLMWRSQLGDKMRHELVIMSKKQALEDLGSAQTTPDAFIVGATLDEPSDGLRLVSELRSRKNTRHAVLAVQDTGEQSRAVSMALDLGAELAMVGEFSAPELAIKVNRLLERKFKIEKLRENLRTGLELVNRDALTGLHNRRYAQSFLQWMQEESTQTKSSFAVMIMDIDNFKSINDRFGHNIGDEVLTIVARRLRENVREQDLLARYGGEEFIVALANTSEREAHALGERLRAAVCDSLIKIQQTNQELLVTLSVGVAISQPGRHCAESVNELISNADRALYISKADGKNLVTIQPTAA